jgi:hypothetical protein
MTSAQTVARGQDWWIGREARIRQKLRACSPAVIPHQAPALPRDAPPKCHQYPRKPAKTAAAAAAAAFLAAALRNKHQNTKKGQGEKTHLVCGSVWRGLIYGVWPGSGSAVCVACCGPIRICLCCEWAITAAGCPPPLLLPLSSSRLVRPQVSGRAAVTNVLPPPQLPCLPTTPPAAAITARFRYLLLGS